MITISSIIKTCRACPSQWEGKTDDGRAVYVRYRGGRLSIRVDDGSATKLVFQPPVFMLSHGHAMAGFMDLDELRGLTREGFTWPAKEGGV